MSSPDDEARHVRVDQRPGIRAKQFDQRAVLALSSGREWIERGELLEDLALLVRGEVAAPDLVVIAGTTGVHHHRAGGRERVLEREMDLVGAACNLADRAHGSVQHDGVAGSDAQATKPIREIQPRMHWLRILTGARCYDPRPSRSSIHGRNPAPTA